MVGAFIALLIAAPGANEQPVTTPIVPEGRSAETSLASRAKTSLAGVFSDGDYPPDALKAHKEGSVSVRLTINAEGKVSGCQLRRSSGVRSLDRVTCDLLSSRAIFEPARDREGRAIEDRLVQRVTWRIPRNISFGDDQTVLTVRVVNKVPSECWITHAGNRIPAPPGECAAMQAVGSARIIPGAPAWLGQAYRVQFDRTILIGDGLPPLGDARINRRSAARLTIDPGGRIVDCSPISQGGEDAGINICRGVPGRFEPQSKSQGSALRHAVFITGVELLPDL